jgi:predicted NUDIX family NTP pyrophosphohydrolase
MAKLSAGLLPFRRTGGVTEVMLVHMGGPFWRSRDVGAWSIPKGEHGEGDEPLAAARREFGEETGLAPPGGEPIDLGAVRQGSGKTVHVWAIEADMDVTLIRSNSFELEWPRGSGQSRRFPEVDRAGWFDLQTARGKLVAGQAPFLDRLALWLVRRTDAGADRGSGRAS